MVSRATACSTPGTATTSCAAAAAATSSTAARVPTRLGGDLADIVTGGDGADTIDGERRRRIYASGGDDRVVDPESDNTVYAQTDDDVDGVMGDRRPT